MKTLRKLTISARQMSHAEMKNVRGAIITPRADCSTHCKHPEVPFISIPCKGTCSATNYVSVTCGEVTLMCPTKYDKV